MKGTGWFAAPNFIFDLPGLTAAQRLVYLYLCRRAGPDGTSWPGIQRIARDVSLHRDTVRRSIEALEKLGLLTRQPRRRPDGGDASYLYTVITSRPPGTNEGPGPDETEAAGGAETRPLRTTQRKDDQRKDNNAAALPGGQSGEAAKEPVPGSAAAAPDPDPLMEQVREFHAYYCHRWRDVFPRGPRLLPGRIRKIKARLRTFTLDELKQACDNLHRSAFHRGHNDQKKPYGTIDYLIRSDEQVDRWLTAGRPAPRPAPDTAAIIEQARQAYEEAIRLWGPRGM